VQWRSWLRLCARAWFCKEVQGPPASGRNQAGCHQAGRMGKEAHCVQILIRGLEDVYNEQDSGCSRHSRSHLGVDPGPDANGHKWVAG